MLRTILCSVAAVVVTMAADPTPPAKAEVEAVLAKAQAFLLAQAQPDGAFVPGTKYTMGVTGLVAEALAHPPAAVPTSDPRMAAAIAYVEKYRQPDGGYYDPADPMGNYCTSIALMLYAATKSGDPAHIQAAQNYLFGIQNRTAGSPNEGGIGYGSKGEGHEDLSNTSFAIQALRASGVPAADPRLQAAVKFLERCQDLSSVNKLPWARDSGGAAYSPEESKAAGSWDKNPPKAGEAPPKLEPYGSMTYALISSYVTLDVKPEDPRVAAALAWVKKNYQFDRNPGIVKNNGQEGLFYYYRVMSKTFDLIDAQSFALPDGTQVDWRADLFNALKTRAELPKGKPDQLFWRNPSDRWGEGLPALVTAYVVRSLKGIHASL